MFCIGPALARAGLHWAFLCGVDRVKRFVYVHCIVNNLKRRNFATPWKKISADAHDSTILSCHVKRKNKVTKIPMIFTGMGAICWGTRGKCPPPFFRWGDIICHVPPLFSL